MCQQTHTPAQGGVRRHQPRHEQPGGFRLHPLGPRGAVWDVDQRVDHLHKQKRNLLCCTSSRSLIARSLVTDRGHNPARHKKHPARKTQNLVHVIGYMTAVVINHNPFVRTRIIIQVERGTNHLEILIFLSRSVDVLTAVRRVFWALPSDG